LNVTLSDESPDSSNRAGPGIGAAWGGSSQQGAQALQGNANAPRGAAVRNGLMVTSTFGISQNSRIAVGPATRAEGECLKYRLDVIAASAADVVASAGGWLYDRAMAGWEVTVLLQHSCDTRSLRILGVQALDPESEPAARFALTGPPSQSLAVSAEAFTTDARVRAKVLESLDDRLTEVALWGRAPQGWPLGVNRAMTRAQHVLSAAARRFKGYALAAAGIGCQSVDPTETLLCDGRSPVVSGLIRLD
jgi:hypothetical protein